MLFSNNFYFIFIYIFIQFGSLGCEEIINLEKESELVRNKHLYYGVHSIKHKIPEFGRKGYNQKQHDSIDWDWDRASKFLGIKPSNVTVYIAKEVKKIIRLSNSKTEIAWGVSSIRGIMRGQNLKIRKLDPIYEGQKFTCYEIECQGTHCPPEDTSISKEAIIKVCYPSVIVTGLAKAGTSAIYELLKLFPNSIHMNEKENCPGAHRRSHWQFFNSLPKVSDIKPFQDSLIVDGCIDLKQNVLMRNILHKPITKYVVMIRNYPDMLWSSYNYWCKLGFDDNCDSTHWTKWGHLRSPALFNDIIVRDKNGEELTKNPLYIKRPCAYAGGYYSEYLNNEVWSNSLKVPPILKQDTIIIASEMLEKFPKIVIQKLIYSLNLDISIQFSPSLDQFGLYRYNTQENKSPTGKTLLNEYKPGLFNVSGNLPMLIRTRELLNECWGDDCIMSSILSGYMYAECFPALIEQLKNNKIEKGVSLIRFDGAKTYQA